MRGQNAGEKTVRIPVRMGKDQRIEYFYGGPLPRITDGTIGDLVIPESSLGDFEDVVRLQQEHVVQFLLPGTRILFAVDERRTPDKLKMHLTKAKGPIFAGKCHGVELVTQEAVLLRLRGTKPAMLADVTCRIPSLKCRAKSLNHAYRLISQRFEPSRLSHTGNVFKLGHVKVSNGWVPLDSLRSAQEARFEMLFSRVASEVFKELPEKLGGVLRQKWGGVLQSPEVLKQQLKRCFSKLQAGLFDPETDEVVAVCDAMLKSICGNTPEEHRRLIQAAVLSVTREPDKKDDAEAQTRLGEDVLVVRAVAEALAGVGRQKNAE